MMAKKWYDPRTWLEKGEIGGYVWVAVTPQHPHAGLAAFSQSPDQPFEQALKVFGLPEKDTLYVAKQEFMGKVIAWEALTDSERALLEKKRCLGLSADRLRALLR
jgi:hypothetical protein